MADNLLSEREILLNSCLLLFPKHPMREGYPYFSIFLHLLNQLLFQNKLEERAILQDSASASLRARVVQQRGC